MLKSLYTLDRKYKDKKVVVYGVNHTSITLFTDLAINHQVDVAAFWDAGDRFTGESFVGREIINTDQLEKLDDAVVVISDKLEKQKIRQYIQKDIVYGDEILAINEDLKDKRIYIYGIGKRGGEIYDALAEKGMDVAGVCVTEPGRIEKWCGEEVLSITQIEQNDRCAVIVATDVESNIHEMLERLEHFDIEKYIFYAMHIGACSQANFFQVIHIALSKHKKIWLYSREDEYSQYMEKVLDRYQISTVGRISDENIYNLEYEKADEISVIILERSKRKTEQVCDTLDSMGWSLEDFNYAAANICTWRVTDHIAEKRDILIGNSILRDEDYPGYVVYGNEKNAKVKIMVLGGSTSADYVLRPASWVSFLYDLLSETGYSPVIYNGAVCAHGIVDEFLHMLRDIEPLKPDYVINFSGVNNTADLAAENPFNTRAGEYTVAAGNDVISGIKSDETLYDFWCRISRLMTLAAEYHGAKVYHFLQPMISADETKDLIKASLHYSEDHTENIGYYKIRAAAETDSCYTNLVSIFEGKDKMYIDQAHYSVSGNRIIAEKIFDVIKMEIEKTIQSRENE